MGKKRLTATELKSILEKHRRFLEGSGEGERADLSGLDLSWVDFCCQDLREVNFRHADLRGVNFRHANLVRVDMSGADVRDADMSYARLSWGVFRDADLRGVRFHNADIIAANMSGAEVSREDLLKASTVRRVGLSGGAEVHRDAIISEAHEVPAVLVEYKGPTDTLGTRLVASYCDGGHKRRTYNRNSEWAVQDDIIRVAHAYAESIRLNVRPGELVVRLGPDRYAVPLTQVVR